MFRNHPKSTVARAIRQRFVVTLTQNDGVFTGLLTEISPISLTFEACKTVPPKSSIPIEDIVGRVHVFVHKIAYLQELPMFTTPELTA